MTEREWAGWFCAAGEHIVTDSSVPMEFRRVLNPDGTASGLTVADCPNHTPGPHRAAR